MVALLIVVSVAVLCVSHFIVFRLGVRMNDREVYYRYYRPLLARHMKTLDRLQDATLEDNASAQQRNVKLLATNAKLRGKAIHYVRAFRQLRHRVRQRTPLDRMVHMLMMFSDTQNELARVRKAIRR